MKNILATAAAAFLLVTSTGCSGFLDEELKSTVGPVLSLTHGERLPQARDKLARTNRSRLQPTLSMPVMATVHWFLLRIYPIPLLPRLSRPIGTGDMV